MNVGVGLRPERVERELRCVKLTRGFSRGSTIGLNEPAETAKRPLLAGSGPDADILWPDFQMARAFPP